MVLLQREFADDASCLDSSIEVIAEGPGLDAFKPCDSAVDEAAHFDCTQAVQCHSSTAHASMNPLNKDGMMERQIGDGTNENSAECFEDRLSRTIMVTNVEQHQLSELELRLEHRRHGGGEFEKFEHDPQHRIVTVVFVDEKGWQICRFYHRLSYVTSDLSMHKHS